LFPSQREIIESRWSFTLLLYSQTPNSKTDSSNKSSGDEIIWMRAATWTTIIRRSIFCLIYNVASCSLCLSFTTGYVPVAHCIWSNTNLGNKTSASIRDPSLQLAHKVFHRLSECNHKHDRNSQLRASSKTLATLGTHCHAFTCI
jgi:hypothetical protein